MHEEVDGKSHRNTNYIRLKKVDLHDLKCSTLLVNAQLVSTMNPFGKECTGIEHRQSKHSVSYASSCPSICMHTFVRSQ